MRTSSSALRCAGPQSKPIAIVTPAARAAWIVSADCSTLYIARSTSSGVQVGIGGRLMPLPPPPSYSSSSRLVPMRSPRPATP